MGWSSAPAGEQGRRHAEGGGDEHEAAREACCLGVTLRFCARVGALLSCAFQGESAVGRRESIGVPCEQTEQSVGECRGLLNCARLHDRGRVSAVLGCAVVHHA